MPDQAEIQAVLKALSDDYAAKLPEKLELIEQAWWRLQREGVKGENLHDLHRMVHSLAGSGKTFGFALLSDIARSMEVHLKQLVQEQKAPDEEQSKHIQVLLSELRQVSISRSMPAGEDKQRLEAIPPVQGLSGLNRIFVVGDDASLVESLKAQLGYFDYEIEVTGNLDESASTLRDAPGGVVLVDISQPGRCQREIETMKAIQQKRGTPLPVIFISACDEFTTRVEAARAGGIAYLTKPVNISSLIDRLDALTSNLPAVPNRILIVDDSEALAAYYATVLEHAGMEVKVVNNPLDVMEPLLEFTPDLILIDVYMPGCNGMELAKVIRQLDAFVGIPIVFLSAESDIEKQLFAMGLGADDFLTKPIQPQHLVSSVTSRVRRSFKLRSFMIRDSLTGLFNHTAIKDRLDYEMAQTRRRGSPFAFAMVDIDHFKKVNDTYGHPAGDRVIKSLARMLRQRLRETDMVGRYGGEEFAVILTNTSAELAAKVLDNIREDFSRLQHLADGKEFSATFSCGVADATQFTSAARLCDAADKALYSAKHAGRNRVMLANQGSAE